MAAIKNFYFFILCLVLFSIQIVAETSQSPQPIKLSPTIIEDLLKLNPVQAGFYSVSFWESIEANSIESTPQSFIEDNGVTIAKLLFERFCANPTLSIPAIPSIVHMIWMGSPPTPTVTLAIMSWKKHHPNWEVRLWTDKEIKALTWSHPKSELLFTQAQNWAEKSDILRFEILYQYGGVYADTDAICLKPLDSLVKSDIGFFGCFEENQVRTLGRPLIGSAVIGSSKNNPILHRCIDYSYTETEQPQLKQHIRSGPGPLSRACYEALETHQKDILILPCSYFYPLRWHKRLYSFEQIIETIRPESFTIHLWEGSWFKD